MKKNIILPALLLIIAANVQAQFESGQRFISGGFSNSLIDNKSGAATEHSLSYHHNINVSVGSFVRATKAVGWGIHSQVAILKEEGVPYRPKSLAQNFIGIDRFVEYYKPLNNKFSLYVRSGVGLSYSLGNSYQSNTSEITFEEQSHSFMLSASIQGGIVWRITPKWALYGSAGLLNPVNIGVKRKRGENFVEKNPEGGNRISKTTAFEYQFSPNGSSGSIGLGFRYFCGLK